MRRENKFNYRVNGNNVTAAIGEDGSGAIITLETRVAELSNATLVFAFRKGGEVKREEIPEGKKLILFKREKGDIIEQGEVILTSSNLKPPFKGVITLKRPWEEVVNYELEFQVKY